jgi:cell division protein FtsW
MAKLVGSDKWIFFTTLLLTVAGLVMVFSASAVVAQERFHSPYSLVVKQAVCALAGVLALVILMRVDYRIYNSPRFIYPALCVTTLLLVMVFFFSGLHNTHRWIHFGNFDFEPSEVAKPVLVLFLAWFLHSRLDAMHDFRNTILRAAIMPVILMILVVRQPDLGTALVLAGVTAMMLIFAGMEWKYLVGAVAVALPFLAALLLLVPWRRERMLVFLNPLSDPMGLIGSMFIVLLFVVLGVRGMRAAFRCQDPFARLTAFGITTTILLQAFFNISVVLSLVPAKGIPLPLISYGGTSIFCTLASIGILLNITRKAE